MDLGTVMNVWEMEQFDGFSIFFLSLEVFK